MARARWKVTKPVEVTSPAEEYFEISSGWIENYIHRKRPGRETGLLLESIWKEGTIELLGKPTACYQMKVIKKHFHLVTKMEEIWKRWYKCGHFFMNLKTEKTWLNWSNILVGRVELSFFRNIHCKFLCFFCCILRDLIWLEKRLRSMSGCSKIPRIFSTRNPDATWIEKEILLVKSFISMLHQRSLG